MASAKDECLVRDVKLRNGQLGPVLVSFEHGRLKKDDSDSLKCCVLPSNNNSKSFTVGAVADNGDVVYQGDVHQAEEDTCCTFLAVRSKRNNKMRIYEASQATLSPSVASNFIDYLDIQDSKQARYNLSHAFGSKRSKRAADQKARMEVNVDAVKDKLSQTVNDIEVNAEDLEAINEDETFSRLLPPCNKNASSPADAYPISGLLNDEELGILEKICKKAVKKNIYPSSTPFFLKQAERVAGNIRSMALFLYADSLMQFCNLKPSLFKRLDGGTAPYSAVIHEKILKDFVTVIGKKVTRSQTMVDKAVMHVIILCLHAGSFQFDLNLIPEHVKRIDIMRTRVLARAIGTVTSSSAKNIAILKIPLRQQSLLMKGRRSKSQR